MRKTWQSHKVTNRRNVIMKNDYETINEQIPKSAQMPSIYAEKAF